MNKKNKSIMAKYKNYSRVYLQTLRYYMKKLFQNWKTFMKKKPLYAFINHNS